MADNSHLGLHILHMVLTSHIWIAFLERWLAQLKYRCTKMKCDGRVLRTNMLPSGGRLRAALLGTLHNGGSPNPFFCEPN